MRFKEAFPSSAIGKSGGEMQDISIQVDASFHHIPRETNDMAGGIAKEFLVFLCLLMYNVA